MNLRSPRIVTRVTKSAKLTPRDWDEIWVLTEEFYDVEREYAEAELRRRQSIAMFRMNDALLGMAAIDLLPTEFRGRNLLVIHTAHVLIREHWRGRNLVQKLGARTFLGARLRHPSAAYLLVLRYLQLQELPAAAAQFPHVLAAPR